MGQSTLTLSQELTHFSIGEEKKRYSNFILNIIPVSSGCIAQERVLLKKMAGIQASPIPLVMINNLF